MVKKANFGEIPDEVLNFAISELKKIRSGEIIFVAQDCYLMQVEVNQRRRISDWDSELPDWSEELCANIRKQIAKEFATLAYGRLVIKIQKGRVVQIERTIQHRFTGLDGEGI